MNLYAFIVGITLLNSSVTADLWEIPDFLSKPQETFQSLTETTQTTFATISGIKCILHSLDVLLQIIIEMKTEIELCGDNTPQQIKDVIQSTNNIVQDAEHIQEVYNENCNGNGKGLTCAMNMFNAVSKIIKSIYITNGLIAKVPNDPVLCGSSTILHFGITLTNLDLSGKC